MLVEDVIHVVIAVLLAVSASVVLVRAAITAVGAAGDDSQDAMVDVLDRLLRVLIFVELLHAVRTTLKGRQIIAEPFLVAGILTASKEIIVRSVKAPSEYLDNGLQFARAMVEVVLLGGLVLLLSGAAVLLRVEEDEPEEGSGGEDVS